MGNAALFFPAMAHGVDLSILACTKYVVGHSDVMMGSVTATADHLAALAPKPVFQLGQCVSPR